jgi:hypothetical protein
VGAATGISGMRIGLATCARVLAFDMTSDDWELAEIFAGAWWASGATCTVR